MRSVELLTNVVFLDKSRHNENGSVDGLSYLKLGLFVLA